VAFLDAGLYYDADRAEAHVNLGALDARLGTSLGCHKAHEH
jgi:hypothetical protein